jgi:DNA primase
MRETEFPDSEEFSSPVLRHIYTILREEADDQGGSGTAVHSALLSPDEMEILAGILQQPGSLTNSRQAVEDYTRVIREQKKIREGTGDLRALAEEMKNKKGYHS